jgi:plasmid stabilization system protein ParE
MRHRLAPDAESDLDSIWFYVATASGNADVADRVVESLTYRFLLLESQPLMGRQRDERVGP